MKMPNNHNINNKKQEIIFRFTIPSQIHVVEENSSSEYFIVSAFGQDYEVEYPTTTDGGSIIGGFNNRRQCAYKLGYIVLPTYYDEPIVEKRRLLLYDSFDCCDYDCSYNDTNENKDKDKNKIKDLSMKTKKKEYQYRVQIPSEIGPGEEFFVTLPNDNDDDNDGQRNIRLIAPIPLPSSSIDDNNNNNNSNRCNYLEFQPPAEDFFREQTLGYKCNNWKVLEKPKKILQVTLPPTPTPPKKKKEGPEEEGGVFPFLLTHIGTLPAIINRPKHDDDDDNKNNINNSNNSSQSSSSSNLKCTAPSKTKTTTTTFTFSVPLAHLPTIRNLPLFCEGENENDEQPGRWIRLYHVNEQTLKWVYVVLTPTPQSPTTTTSTTRGGSNSISSIALSNNIPLAFCCCYNKNTDRVDAAAGNPNTANTSPKTLHWGPAIFSPGLPTTITSLDRKTLDGEYQTIGTYWEIIGSLGESSRREHLSKWRLKLQGEGRLIFSLNKKENNKRVVVEEQPPVQTSSDTTYELLDFMVEQIQNKLGLSPRLLRRQSWELHTTVDDDTPSLSSSQLSLSSSSRQINNDWVVELTTQLLQRELRRTPGDPNRWELHEGSCLDCCRLLGILIGKSIVETKRPIFPSSSSHHHRGNNYNLARYIYKHILQWPIQEEDLVEVDGTTPMATGDQHSSTEDALRERFFERIQQQLAAILDGLFIMIPRSFLLVFRSVDELENCLVLKT